MAKPCVLDVKISFSSSSKTRVNLTESSTILEFGFLLSGMQIFKASAEEPVFYSRATMSDLDAPRTREKLREFFNYENDLGRSAVVDLAISKCTEVSEHLLRTDHYRLKSASLLLAYDANSEETLRAKLIDFGKVDYVAEAGHDTALLRSLQNFISFLEEI